jgi:hypothetical protein
MGVSSPLLAAAWDPNKRDYASLDDGMDPTDAHVIHALYVTRGTGACVLETGLDPMPDTMDDAMEANAAASVRLALAPLLTAGDIRIKSVKLTHRDDATQTAEVTVSYINLRTGQPRATRMSLPSAPVEV